MRRLPTLIAAVVLAGCASEAKDLPTATVAGAPTTAATPVKASGYELSKKELGMDCARLTGHMRIRMMQMRNDATRERTTSLSRTMNEGAVMVNGASKRGVDPTADLARDRAMLEAYNARLAERNCKTLDINAELRGETPPPKPPAAKPAPGAGAAPK